MSLAGFFESLGAPLVNNRWSLGAVRENGNDFLRVWQGGTSRKSGKLLVQVADLKECGDGRGGDSLAYAERLGHVDMVRKGARIHLVMLLA